MTFTKNNLLNLDAVTALELKTIFKRADYLQTIGIDQWKSKYAFLHNRIFVNMFFESSTRTQYSFEVAAAKLGMHVVTFNSETSSVNKSETLYDSVKTFESLGADAVCIRHPMTNYYDNFGALDMAIINGGDGTGRHPTQSLLDLYTIYKEFKSFDNLKVLIIGDIVHSRVAKTNILMMEKLGITVKVTGPKAFADPQYNNITKIDDLSQYDVVMLLRYQKERHGDKHDLNQGVFYKEWGFTKERYQALKPTAIIMHPGPVNRGIEIDSDLVESPKSRIFQQMANGIAIRAALITLLLAPEGH